MIADLVLRDGHGGYIVDTYMGVFGLKKHYDADCSYIGETWEGFAGDTTDLDEAIDSFDPEEW